MTIVLLSSSVAHDKEWIWVQGSVEERIMELVKNRREGTAMGAAGGAAAAANREYDEHRRAVRNGKMKQQDVAGSIAMDRQNLRMAELQRLFQVRNAATWRFLVVKTRPWPSLVFQHRFVSEWSACLRMHSLPTVCGLAQSSVGETGKLQ